MQVKADAVGYKFSAVAIIAALGGFDIKQLAGDIGQVNFTIIFVFSLNQTAFSAAIAQSFPLCLVEAFERFFPKITGSRYDTHR